ncbi:MAG: WD40/YVTN/BNR-like repeat-containing protein [Candidatus Sumerlaeia bacterium]
MIGKLFLASQEGVVLAENRETGWAIVSRGLKGKSCTSIAYMDEIIYAGAAEGCWISEDPAQEWRQHTEGLKHKHIRWLACGPPETHRVFAGTEPAAVFFYDGNGSWWDCSEVEGLRDKNGWFLPYSDGAGCVRGFDFDKNFAYAAVEVGGLLWSDDFGHHWDLVKGATGNPDTKAHELPHVHPDVHSVTLPRDMEGVVFAATGGGLFLSTNQGKQWCRLYECYCRAVWVNPDNRLEIVLGPADGVSENGRIEYSKDGGESWQDASGGLDTPWPERMVERFLQMDDQLLALLSDGTVLASIIDEWEWEPILQDAGKVYALAKDHAQ